MPHPSMTTMGYGAWSLCWMARCKWMRSTCPRTPPSRWNPWTAPWSGSATTCCLRKRATRTNAAICHATAWRFRFMCMAANSIVIAVFIASWTDGLRSGTPRFGKRRTSDFRPPSRIFTMTNIAIIGGGAAGAAVFGALLARDADDTLHWVAGDAAPAGFGVAYSTQAEHHLLNVRASGMGLYLDADEDFASFSARQRAGAK